MPFRSASQTRACFAKGDPRWNCRAWAAETPDIKGLPERRIKMGEYTPKLKGKKKVRIGGN